MQPSYEPSKPLMIYDGDCGFCRGWVRRWQLATGDRVEYAPFQEAAERFTHIPREQFARAVHLIEPNGDVFTGAQAVFRSLAFGARKRWPLWLYEHMPGVAPVTESGYRFVADHRRLMSAITRLLWGLDTGPPSYVLTRWLFIRLLAVIYLIAFVSLGVQILGLVGSNGILPAADYLERLHSRFGDDAYWRFPTLAWLDSSDRFLQLLCWGGAGVSVLVILRIAPGPLLFLLWVIYLSLYRVGQTFLSFQWDLLLLEAGFLGILLASWKPWPRLSTDSRPSPLVRWMIMWLLFRLMFSSGIVKLLDESDTNPTWANLTALDYHYETQCIPNAGAWYAHQLPDWFGKFSVLSMFAIEIGVPFLFFLPRRPRIFGCFLQVFFQVLIMATGNYNFFNLLTIVLCVSLLDDAFLQRFFPKRLVAAAAPGTRRRPSPLVKRLVVWPLAAVVLALSVVWMSYTLRKDRSDRRVIHDEHLPKPAAQVIRFAMRFSSVQSYGLFRSMTTRRPEIIVEGSNDRRTWKPYEFKWKPGDLERRPSQVAPHQPRLDWQMWFAALGNYRSRRNQWFLNFERRLLEGSPEVLALLETNPFPDEPPRFIRAVLYDYHYTDWETRRDDGTWWTRDRLRLYTPVLSLNSFKRR